MGRIKKAGARIRTHGARSVRAPQIGAGQITEKQWLQQVRDLARLLGWLEYHTYDSRRSSPGFPDLVLVHRAHRRLIFAELKRERGRVSPAQQEWFDALREAGQEAYVWRPSEFEAVHRILKGEGN